MNDVEKRLMEEITAKEIAEFEAIAKAKAEEEAKLREFQEL